MTSQPGVGRSRISTDRRAFGVGYSIAAVETIFPQVHDIPMDAIVTEFGVQSTPNRLNMSRLPSRVIAYSPGSSVSCSVIRYEDSP